MEYLFDRMALGNISQEEFYETLLKAARYHVTTQKENMELDKWYREHPDCDNWRIAYHACGIRLFDEWGNEVFYLREKDTVGF